MIYFLFLIVLVAGSLVYFYKSNTFNIDVTEGSHKNVKIGMSRSQVLAALRDNSNAYNYVTTNTPKTGYETSRIVNSKNDNWVLSQYWTLTPEDNGNLLKAFRISFEKDKVTRIEEWSRLFETP
jgi:preprotein translocase subunit SecF